MATGELRDRHHLDRRHAELCERRQVLDRGIERPLAGERADVQLVDDEIAEGVRLEVVVGPRERLGVDDARGSRAGPRAGDAKPGRVARRSHRGRRRSPRLLASRRAPRGCRHRRGRGHALRRPPARAPARGSAPRRERRRCRRRAGSRRAVAPRGRARRRRHPPHATRERVPATPTHRRAWLSGVRRCGTGTEALRCHRRGCLVRGDSRHRTAATTIGGGSREPPTGIDQLLGAGLAHEPPPTAIAETAPTAGACAASGLRPPVLWLIAYIEMLPLSLSIAEE